MSLREYFYKGLNEIKKKYPEIIGEIRGLGLIRGLKMSVDNVKFIEKLNKLDTKNNEPLTSIAETKLYLREDNIKDANIRDQILENSPEKNKEYFVVPKVVE